MFKIFFFSFLYFGFFYKMALGDGSFQYLVSQIVDLFPVGNHNISPQCRRDFQEFLKGLLQLKGWAVTMFDSMEKFPSGFAIGRTTAFGQFEECLGVVRPNFTGKHCVVEVQPKAMAPNSTLREMPVPVERLLNPQFGYGVCVPSTCNSTDLKNVINGFWLTEAFRIDVTESGCTSHLSTEFRMKDYIVVGFFLFLIFLAVASTAYDVLYTPPPKAGTQHELLKSFSLLSNVRRLFQISESSQEINSLHGMRFFSFVWMIFGHLYHFEYLFGSDVNCLHKLSIINDKATILATNAFFCVDTFFFLSGLLVCFVFFRNISKKGYYDAPVALIHRYLRLTPLLAVIILFNFTIFSRTAVAPYSKMFFEQTESNCRENWWTYLLYIDNYLNLAKRWYLSADMQMFLVSPLILYVLLLWPKFAPTYLGVLILGSSLVSFITCYQNDLPPNLVIQRIMIQRGNLDIEYIWFHTRMTPWFVGVATAYIICGIKAKKITFAPSKVWIVVGWLVSIGLCVSGVYSIAAFYPFHTALDHSTLERSSYRAFSRLGWSLGLSWIVIACVNGYGGAINAFLSHNAFQPLAKLSYGAFIVHYSLQIFRNMKEFKVLKHYNPLRMTYTFFGDLTGSFIVAIPLVLLIEMPIGNMERTLLEKLVIFPFPKRKSKSLLDENLWEVNYKEKEDRNVKSCGDR